MARPKKDMERKSQILDALERIVIRDGIAKLTLAKVAAEAGLPRPLLRYFAGNKSELILLLFDRMLERGEAKLAGLQEIKEGAVKVDDILDLLFDGLMADPELNAMVEQLWPYSAGDERIQTRLRDLYHRVCQEIVAHMCAERPGLNEDDCFDRAYGVVAMAFGASFFSDINFKPNDPEAFRRLARDMLQSGSVN